MNPLLALQDYGQSVWLDYMQRHLITSGELQRLIDEDGLRGMTSNPAIFEKAITGSTDYLETLRALSGRNLDAMGLYEQLAIRDIQDAADIFRPVYEHTRRGDGYISLEVSPHLAHDTQGTIREARRLWQTVSRPNLMIKVPATPAGLPAIEQLISEGINVNVTLLFAQEVYERVAEAYIAGLERLAAAAGNVGGIASVASFFISRIDTAIDAQVMARLKAPRVRRSVPCCAACSATSPLPTASSRTNATRRSSREPVGRHWRPWGHGHSGCCGPVPAPRIQSIAMSSTSRN